MVEKAPVIAIVILIAALVACGCLAYKEDADAIANTTMTTHQQHVNRVWSDNRIAALARLASIDKMSIPEDNVTCYVLWYGDGSGISCMRDDV